MTSPDQPSTRDEPGVVSPRATAGALRGADTPSLLGPHRGDTLSVPVLEETARVDTRVEASDRVRITTHKDLVDETLHETLRTDEVEVMRVPVDRTLGPGEDAPKIRTEGDVTIVPVLEEIVVVEKRLHLREELHILRDVTTREVEVPVTLRKQRAVVERTGSDGLAESEPS